ncbi:unnamed protein product [Medioppia subpectinata]|uniref:UDP-glycosyltransferase n=1 Tax=Medioppia subpectinata TaxID=1979941 RepID=A0A7R9PXJ0_9ACAR|nr:unnamed protein product [Medioppia subpectinata]CAG2104069.1 unnamed protein product [Medioppia subpectinata]
MGKNMTILFASVPGVGHVNACIGLAEVLLSRGHKIVFAVDQSFAGKLSPFGFIEETVTSDEMKGEKAGEYSATNILSSGVLFGVSALEKLKIMRNLSIIEVFVDALRQNEPQMKEFVAKHNPDVIVIDNFAGSPALMYANRPWVGVCSMNPLFAIPDDRTPPPGSGLSMNGDRDEWKAYEEDSGQMFANARNNYNKWMKEKGLPTVETNSALMLNSPYLNIYGFPEELDYTDIRPIPQKWLRVDAFMRRGEKQEFKIPDKFRDRDVEKKMVQKLTILFAPVEGVGHVNACIGLAEVLLSRGHKIVFVVNPSFAGKLSPFGFIEEIMTSEETNNKKPGEDGARSLIESGLLSNVTSYESMKIMQTITFFDKLVDTMRANEPQLKAIVAKHNPDLYIIDDFAGSPTLIHSTKPWVSLFSGNPLFVINDERTPPGSSGYPSNGDRKEWEKFKELSKDMFKNQSFKYNEWMKEKGFPVTTNNRAIDDSPYLNIYGYPEELDYTDLRPLPEKWLRVDAFMRRGEKQEFKIPDKFRDRDIEKRLLGDTYELADNMWGENSVPQTKVLPLVDVVITHGGNNSVTETFSFGKPMIIMPLFADQYDNAQRVMEKGFGIRLNPHTVSEQELLNSIEKLLNDKELKHKLSVASKRMLNSNSLQKAAEKIENLIQ